MFFRTSEAVSKGHPDKLADQIADAILDKALEIDSAAHCACEVAVSPGKVVLQGELSESVLNSNDFYWEVEPTVKNAIRTAGYGIETGLEFNDRDVEIKDFLVPQSEEINSSVLEDYGAGDQGVVWGHAVSPRVNALCLPTEHFLAVRLMELIEEAIANDANLLPDAKCQITLAFSESGMPEYVSCAVISMSHKPSYDYEDLKFGVESRIIASFQAAFSDLFVGGPCMWMINPAGEWNKAGPDADSGLTGRKLVVDNYGPSLPIGGGSFSGKDPSKVDRSGAYMARFVAKALVLAKVAPQASVSIAYAIGEPKPVNVQVYLKDAKGTSLPEDFFSHKVRHIVIDTYAFDSRSVVKELGLRNGISYRKVAEGCHYRDKTFPWENVRNCKYHGLSSLADFG